MSSKPDQSDTSVFEFSSDEIVEDDSEMLAEAWEDVEAGDERTDSQSEELPKNTEQTHTTGVSEVISFWVAVAGLVVGSAWVLYSLGPEVIVPLLGLGFGFGVLYLIGIPQAIVSLTSSITGVIDGLVTTFFVLIPWSIRVHEKAHQFGASLGGVQYAVYDTWVRPITVEEERTGEIDYSITDDDLEDLQFAKRVNSPLYGVLTTYMPVPANSTLALLFFSGANLLYTHAPATLPPTLVTGISLFLLYLGCSFGWLGVISAPDGLSFLTTVGRTMWVKPFSTLFALPFIIIAAVVSIVSGILRLGFLIRGIWTYSIAYAAFELTGTSIPVAEIFSFLPF